MDDGAGLGLALAPLAVAALGFVVFCLVDLARHPVRILPRWVWAVVVIASVPLGGILYLLAGRDHGNDAGPPPPPSPPPPSPPAASATSSSASAPAPVPDVRPRRAPDPAGAPIVRTAGLRKVYGAHAALDGVDLVVPRGSVYGLVGPNGSGKTTLLSILAGLRRPSAGSVEVVVPRARVAVLPDTPSFDEWLTAREVVDLARVLVAPDLPAARVDEALARTGLTDAADRRVGGFSRGMLQRLGLAATVVGEPELLLLDEPCSALDPLGRREVLDLIGRLGGDTTVLFCSHILGDVQELCDTVGVLKDGHLLFQGPLGDLLVGRANPAWTVRARAPLGDVAERLRAQPWVEGVDQLGPEELRVRARSVDDAERGLAGALAEAGARLVSVTPAATDLEDVFLELTR